MPRGRPFHVPTDETRAEVKALASHGVPQEVIGKYIGISHPTLRKHYEVELETAAIMANKVVGDFLWDAASGAALKKNLGAEYKDCLKAAIFWAKARMDWSERSEVTGKDGGPIQLEDVTRRDADAFTRSIAGLATSGAAGSEAIEPDAGDES